MAWYNSLRDLRGDVGKIASNPWVDAGIGALAGPWAAAAAGGLGKAITPGTNFGQDIRAGLTGGAAGIAGQGVLGALGYGSGAAHAAGAAAANQASTTAVDDAATGMFGATEGTGAATGAGAATNAVADDAAQGGFSGMLKSLKSPFSGMDTKDKLALGSTALQGIGGIAGGIAQGQQQQFQNQSYADRQNSINQFRQQLAAQQPQAFNPQSQFATPPSGPQTGAPPLDQMSPAAKWAAVLRARGLNVPGMAPGGR